MFLFFILFYLSGLNWSSRQKVSENVDYQREQFENADFSRLRSQIIDEWLGSKRQCFDKICRYTSYTLINLIIVDDSLHFSNDPRRNT